MEKSLNTLSILNKSLINEKDEIKKKLFEKLKSEAFNHIKESEVNDFFERVSYSIKDEEFKKLRIKYKKLTHLTSSIDYFMKEF